MDLSKRYNLITYFPGNQSLLYDVQFNNARSQKSINASMQLGIIPNNAVIQNQSEFFSNPARSNFDRFE